MPDDINHEMWHCYIALFSMSANNVQQRLQPIVCKNEGFKHKAKEHKPKTNY